MRFSFLTAMMHGLKAINFSALKISFLKSMPSHHQAEQAAANSCGFQGYTGRETLPMSEVLCTSFLGGGGQKEKPEGILETWVIPALHLGSWTCFDLIYFFLSLQHLLCKIPRVSRALETQTLFFNFGFKIMHSVAGIQFASGNNGVDFHHQKTVKTVQWSLNRIFEMSKELLWGSTGRIRDPLRARFKYFIIRTIVLCKDDVLNNYTDVVLMTA